jgi:peptidoglycan/LPS O-acetylase OafA/YrhL
VNFFFVLSGFVITHAYSKRVSGPSEFRLFFFKRLGRIYPLHIFMLSMFVLLELAKLGIQHVGAAAGQAPFHGSNSLPALVGNVLLLNGMPFIFQGFTWNGPSWSISTEFAAYILFAIVCMALRRRFVLSAAVIAIGCGAWVLSQEFAAHPMAKFEGMGLTNCLFGFFLGALTYRLFSWAASSGWRPAPYAEVLAIALICFAFGVRFRGSAGLDPALFAIAIFIFAFEAGWASRLLSTPVPRFLGQVSYSIYLVHAFVLATLNGALRAVASLFKLRVYTHPGGAGSPVDMISFGGPWAMDALAVCYLGVVICIAAVTYHYVEAPWRTAANEISRGRSFSEVWRLVLKPAYGLGGLAVAASSEHPRPESASM